MFDYKKYISDDSVIARFEKYTDLLADYGDNRHFEEYDTDKVLEVFDICEAIYFFDMNFYDSDINPWLDSLKFKAGIILSKSNLSLIHCEDFFAAREIYLDLVRYAFIKD
jgi:hypothetical protein